MAVEAATYINQLDPTNPRNADMAATGAAHIRMQKSAMLNTFSEVKGPVTSSHIHLSNPLIQTTPLANTIAYYNSNSTATVTNVSTIGLSLLGAANTTVAINTLNLDARYVQGAGGAITGNASISGAFTVSGAAAFGSTLAAASVTTGALTVTSASPTITLKDTDHRSALLHTNANTFYVLRGGVNSDTFDSGPNGRHPLTLSLETGDLTASGTAGGYSDVRLKTNIATIPNALEKVKALRGVTFDWTQSGVRSLGVIAQDVQAVLPEAVRADEDGFLSVAYGNLSAALFVEAIKELVTEVEALKAR